MTLLQLLRLLLVLTFNLRGLRLVLLLLLQLRMLLRLPLLQSLALLVVAGLEFGLLALVRRIARRVTGAH